jgi:hypothetical protein
MLGILGADCGSAGGGYGGVFCARFEGMGEMDSNDLPLTGDSRHILRGDVDV